MHCRLFHPLLLVIVYFLLGANLPVDPCRVFGVIYIDPYPDRVEFLVYQESSEAFADLLVYDEENRLFADQSGMWHITDNRALADHTIHLVDDSSPAHFSIYFTNVASFAGCR